MCSYFLFAASRGGGATGQRSGAGSPDNFEVDLEIEVDLDFAVVLVVAELRNFLPALGAANLRGRNVVQVHCTL